MNHLLVIRLSALGDAAILAPVVRNYATANPDVRFTVAAPPMLEPLFCGMAPNVDFLGVKKKQSSQNIYRQLRDVGADAVADMHRVNRVNRALVMLWIHEMLHLHFHFRIRHLHKGRLSRLMVLKHLSRKARRPQYLRYGDVFHRLGLTKATEIPCKSDSSPAQTLTNPTIGVAPFSQHEGKVWPLEYTAQLCRMLAAQGCQVLLFGSRDEAPQLEAIASDSDHITSMAGKLSFQEELETIGRLTLMVSMDSANMHFASAVGTPVVSIWGATHPDFGFYGYRQNTANALCAHLPCQPCSAYGQLPCRYGDYRCMHAITPQQVQKRINENIDIQHEQ